MKKVSLVVDRYYQKNLVFDENLNKKTDGRLNKLISLKNKFNSNGYEIATNDIINQKSADIIIYYDTIDNNINCNDNAFLILVESIIVKPEIYNRELHQKFNKIFTWNDDLVDNCKYFKLNLAHKLPTSINKKLEIKEKLCVMISTNRVSSVENELYTERLNAIRWFEKNRPLDFDLYGMGWDEYSINSIKPIRIINRSILFRRVMHYMFGAKYPSYRGTVLSKIRVINKYRFTICYENVQNVPGYITEKIFDAFVSGCVPIYLGANNIKEYVPSECFIDKRNFASYSDLYSYISTMSDSKYLQYLENIETYLNSTNSDQFRDVHYANILFNAVVSA